MVKHMQRCLQRCQILDTYKNLDHRSEQNIGALPTPPTKWIKNQRMEMLELTENDKMHQVELTRSR